VRRLTEHERQLLTDALQHLVDRERVGDATDKIEQYLALLVEWNQRGNIVSKSDLHRLVERHVLESLAAVPLLDALGGKELVDIGSGGGFPGVLIKIVRPQLHVVLLESRRMKSLFLQKVIERLALDRTWVLKARAEEAVGTSAAVGAGITQLAAGGGPARRAADPLAEGRGFDLATARAVAAIAELTEWAARLLRPGGHLVTFKGSRLEAELGAWTPAPGVWREPRIVETTVPHLRLVALQRV
jgi:16S rRNA (guanine527-N7)-methyltransferase